MRLVRGLSVLAVAAAMFVATPILLVPEPDGVAYAQRKPKRPPPETKKVQAVRKWAFERLTAAQEHISEERYAEALPFLRELERNPNKLNEHETALMHQTYAHLYASQDQYRKAITSFEAAIATGGLSAVVEQSIRYNVGQLYVVTEQYQKGIDVLLEWLDLAEDPQPVAFIMIAQAYVQMDRYNDALPYAEKAVAMTDSPREPWLNLVLALYFEKEDYKKAVSVLETLATRFSKKNYWIQLSAVYGSLGREKDSLVAMEIAHREGFLDRSQDLVRMAELYLYHDVPFKAGLILEKGLKDDKIESNKKHWELLANSWINAQEMKRAMQPMERAANLADDGKLWMRLGQVHMENEDWGEASKALIKAVSKGDLGNDTGQAHLLLGIARFNLGQHDRAERSFKQALRHKRSEKPARQWLRHVRNLNGSEEG